MTNIDHDEMDFKKLMLFRHRSKYGVLVAFIEYQSSESVYIAQHLTSTVFIDKPIVVIPAGKCCVCHSCSDVLCVSFL